MSSTILEKPCTIAIAGNPNSGKTTLFNQLTGLRHKIGNYPGITVEKKVGALSSEDDNIQILDLPGTYALSPRSEEERIAADVIKGLHKKDVTLRVALLLAERHAGDRDPLAVLPCPRFRPRNEFAFPRPRRADHADHFADAGHGRIFLSVAASGIASVGMQ